MHSEDDLLPISGLQHLLFCERQCALIHVEQLWNEDRRTSEGRQMHERVHEQGSESRGDVRIARGLPLRSLRLGLIGKADVVEFHRSPAHSTEPREELDTASRGLARPDSPVDGASASSGPLWLPFPVEYKRGKPKAGRCDEVQLCAQALCLEEMRNVSVPAGALFYGVTRRRKEVFFDAPLRQLTEQAAERLHRLVDAGVTPPANAQRHCRNCSLAGLCLPKAGAGKSAARYLQRMIRTEVADAKPVKDGSV